MSVVQDTKLPRDDEERRLLADYEACHTEKLAAAEQLLNPRHSMLYPAYKRLVDLLAAIRLKCDEKWFAVRTHRKKMQDGREIALTRHSSRCKKLLPERLFDLPDLLFNFASRLFGFAFTL